DGDRPHRLRSLQHPGYGRRVNDQGEVPFAVAAPFLCPQVDLASRSSEYRRPPRSSIRPSYSTRLPAAPPSARVLSPQARDRAPGRSPPASPRAPAPPALAGASSAPKSSHSPPNKIKSPDPTPTTGQALKGSNFRHPDAGRAYSPLRP